MAKLKLIRIEDGKETVLEVTQVPDSFNTGSVFYPAGSIEKLEEYHARTGKPKRGYIDVIYICRPQVERWDIGLLEKYAPSLEAAREKLKRRKILPGQ